MLTSTGLPASFSLRALSSSDHTRTSLQRKLPQPNNYRRIGIRSQLLVPLLVGGRVVATVGFGAFRSTREWPDEFIARVRVIGEVIAQALVRTRSVAALRTSGPVLIQKTWSASSVLYDEVAGQGNGPIYLPIHYRGPQ